MIPNYLKTHKEYNKNNIDIDKYFKSLSDKDIDAMSIAFKYLNSSFSIVKSNGFRKWKDDQSNH